MPSTISCEYCEGDSSTCGCWHCEGCYEWLEVTVTKCACCGKCYECCSCWQCTGCSVRFRWSDTEHTRCDTCYRCETCVCTCYTCTNCGVRREDTSCRCTSCLNCTDCCRCVTCGACGERGPRTCRTCNHCSNCLCECSTSATECSSCHRRQSRCYCVRCHVIDQNTAIIQDSHSYNPESGDPDDRRCPTCGCCKRHCTGSSCAECAAPLHAGCTFCGKCKTCCKCIVCSVGTHLLTSEDERCTFCKRCQDHCICPKCPACDERSKSFCKHCSKCKSCCMAEESKCWAFGREYAIQLTSPPLTKWTPDRKGLRRLPNPRLIGVEIEVNSLNRKGLAKSRKFMEAVHKWCDGVVRDGSIGDLPAAFEINTMPSGGDLFLDHLKDITDGLADMSAKPDDSCGVHVHIDASDFEVYDLNRVIRLYAKVERSIFDLCHPSRLNCHYAQACGKYYVEQGVKANPAEFRKNLVSKLYYEGQDLKAGPTQKDRYCRNNFGCSYARAVTPQKEAADKYAIKEMAAVLKKEKQHKYRGVRYKALNLHSYFLRKTIEFRHHEKAVDYEQLTGWAMVCQELVTCGYRMSQSQIDALPRNSRRTVIALMPQRLHQYIIETWKKNDAIRKLSPAYTGTYNAVWGDPSNPSAPTLDQI